MRAILTLPAALALCSSVYAQPSLLPPLNAATLPADADAVCTIPDQVPPIETSGRSEGETAADFTAYDLNGNVFNLGAALALGKPVLMIAGSYTCPVFRNKIPSINSVVATYGSAITTVIVYTVEAHPYIDISPYFGAVNTHPANIAAGILYQQPTTYGERKAVAQDLLDSMTIDAPVYLDGPCNEWWNYYGQAPNCAYLIDTTGFIVAHHAWYDKFPEHIVCDIDSLLGIPGSCDETFDGELHFQLTGNDTVYGEAGTTLYGSGFLWNTGNASVLARVAKLTLDMPPGWSSSLCLDVCYSPSVDTALVSIAAGDTLHFYYYFYTSAVIDTGFARIGLHNENDHLNGYDQRYWGITTASTTGSNEVFADDPRFSIHPNPCSDVLRLSAYSPGDVLLITDMQGRQWRSPIRDGSVDIAGLAPGLYGVCLERSGQRSSTVLRLVKQ